MASEPVKRSVWTDPGIILLGVLLLMSAIVFVWWPADTAWNGMATVGWLMLGTIPVSILITGVYVVWMERLEKAAGKDIDADEYGS